MKAFETLIESSYFFPILIVVLILLVCIFIYILFFDKTSKSSNLDIITPIDETAKLSLFDESGEEISEENLELETNILDDLDFEDNNVLEEDETLLPKREDKISENLVNDLDHLIDEKTLEKTLSENPDDYYVPSDDDKIDFTPIKTRLFDDIITNAKNDMSPSMQALTDDFTKEMSVLEDVIEKIEMPKLKEKPRVSESTIEIPIVKDKKEIELTEEEKEAFDTSTIEKIAYDSNKTEVFEFPDFDEIEAGTKLVSEIRKTEADRAKEVEDAVIDAANSYIMEIMMSEGK